MYINFRGVLATLMSFSILLSGCSDSSIFGPENASRSAARDNGPGLFGVDSQNVFDPNNPQSQIQFGTDEFLGASNAQRGPLFEEAGNGEISLNLVNVSISAAARAILGDALGLNYTVDPAINGKISLQSTKPMDTETLLETFQTILEINGATLDQTNNLVAVVPFSQATRRIARLGEAGGIGARIVAAPLENISTTEMIRLLTPIIGQNVLLQGLDGRNILLIAGTRSEINATVDAINLFDTDVMKGKSIALIKLRSADSIAVAQELNLIFETGEGGALEGLVEFIPSPRLDSILVISSRAKYITEAQIWIDQLDSAASGARRRPVVYQLESRSAEDLAPILSEMMPAQATSGGGSGAADAVSAPIEQPRVIADKTNNAIVIWGNDREQESFARLIRTLDTVPVQVLLEITIAEVALTDELSFGLRWFFEQQETSGAATDLVTGVVASTFPGLSFLFQGINAGVSLNALASITRVNIVSTPSLMVLDNATATLQIGDVVPVATQQTQDPNNLSAPPVSTISFRDTGILLTVRPRVSSSGRVMLEIDQEVSSVSNTTTSGIDSPTISQRRITTSVVVNDRATLALGGLIQDNVNDTRDQIPGLGDIPLLGNLFRTTTDTRSKTELLILITPRVIRNGVEAEQITDELRQQINGANQLIFGPGTDASLSHRFLN